MKKILIGFLIGVVVTALFFLGYLSYFKNSQFGSTSEKSGSKKLSFEEEVAILKGRSGATRTAVAEAEIDEFSSVMNEPSNSGRLIGDEYYGGVKNYPDHSNPFKVTVKYTTLSSFILGADHLIVYPAIRTSSPLLGLMLAKTDASGTISAYFDSKDGANALEIKDAFKETTIWKQGEVEDKLLGPFYNSSRKFYSIKIPIVELNKWLVPKLSKGIDSIQFIPGKLFDMSNSIEKLTVLLKAVDVNGQAIGDENDTYFNMTLPCPPPNGCR